MEKFNGNLYFPYYRFALQAESLDVSILLIFVKHFHKNLGGLKPPQAPTTARLWLLKTIKLKTNTITISKLHYSYNNIIIMYS